MFWDDSQIVLFWKRCWADLVVIASTLLSFKRFTDFIILC